MNRDINWRRWRDAVIDPSPAPELEAILAERRKHVPVLWLLGLTGAGKTSVIQRLTGDSRAVIGNGFEPCTRSAVTYDYPQDMPLMRFLDTRGLGEAGYDATEDLAASRQGSHAALILTRVDEPNQKPLISALRQISAQKKLAALHIHTAIHSIDESQLQRAMAHQHEQVTDALSGRDLPQLAIDFTDPEDGFDDPDRGLDALIDAIVALVPELSDALQHDTASDQEQALFQLHRTEVLAYASAAAASDVIPAVGLLSVPVLQGKMIHALAGRYDVPWNSRLAREFLAALGGSFLYRYSLSLLGRQLVKFVPGIGQSVGAAAAASISFASTWALGRTVCYYLYRRCNHQTATREELQAMFRAAFRERRADNHSSAEAAAAMPDPSDDNQEDKAR